MGWSPDGRGLRRRRLRAPLAPRAAMRICLGVAEAAALLGVLALDRRLSVAWCLWATAVTLGLTSLDRRLASRVTPRVVDLDRPGVRPHGRRRAGGALVMRSSPPRRTSRSWVSRWRLRSWSHAGSRWSRCGCCAGAAGCGIACSSSARARLRTGWRALSASTPAPACAIIGLVDDDASSTVTRAGPPRRAQRPRDVARQHRIDRILLAFSSKPEAQMVRLLVDCERVSRGHLRGPAVLRGRRRCAHPG